MPDFNSELGLRREGEAIVLDTRPEHQVAPGLIHFAVLATLGEVAAAFAGFSGVVAAFGHRTPTEWSEAARFRFENLLTVSVAASILAFLPVVLTQFSISAARAWAVISSSTRSAPTTFPPNLRPAPVALQP